MFGVNRIGNVLPSLQYNPMSDKLRGYSADSVGEHHHWGSYICVYAHRAAAVKKYKNILQHIAPQLVKKDEIERII